MRITKRIPATVIAVATASTLVLSPALPGMPLAQVASAQTAAGATGATATQTIVDKVVNDTWTYYIDSRGSSLDTSFGGYTPGRNTDPFPFGTGVKYPDIVRPGEEFTVTVTPGAMTVGSEWWSRFKYDIALPSGVEIKEMHLEGGSISGGSYPGVTPTLRRVDASGAPSQTGAFARIADQQNRTVKNSPDASDRGGSWRTDTFAKSGAVQLPSVVFTVVAPKDGQEVVFGLRAAGAQAAAGSNDTMSFMEDGYWSDNAVYVNAGPASQRLTVTKVEAVSTAVALDATAEQTPNEQGEIPVHLSATATVDPTDVPLTGAKIQFEKQEGSNWGAVGEPVDAASGTAALDTTTPDVDGDVAYRARLIPAENAAYRASESEPKTVNVKAELKTSLELADVPASVEPGTDVPLKATYKPEGRDLAASQYPEIVFKADGTEIGHQKANQEGIAEVTYRPEKSSDKPVVITAEAAEVTSGERTFPAAKSAEKQLSVAYVQRESSIAITTPENGADMSSGFQTVTAKIDVPEGAKLDGGKVEFKYINADHPEWASLGFGKAGGDGTYTIRRPFAPGETQLKAVFSGTPTAKPSESEVVKVTHAMPRVTVTDTSNTAWDAKTPQEVTAGEKTPLKVRVTHADADAANQQPVLSGTVDFFIGEDKFGTATLDGTTDGYATIEHDFAGLTGEQTVVAKYSGLSNNQGTVVIAPSEASTKLTVQAPIEDKKTSTAVTAEWVGDKPVEDDNPAKVSATVTDAEGKPVPAGIPVEFFDGETSLGKADTDASGVATLADVKLSNADHAIKAVAGEKEIERVRYGTSEGTTELKAREAQAEPEKDPTKDTDSDGISDADEISGKLNNKYPNDKFNPNGEPGNTSPDQADSDGDTLSDKDEIDRGTNPNKGDTDGDGYSDADEVKAGTNPTDADSHPVAAQPSEPTKPSTPSTPSTPSETSEPTQPTTPSDSEDTTSPGTSEPSGSTTPTEPSETTTPTTSTTEPNEPEQVTELVTPHEPMATPSASDPQKCEEAAYVTIDNVAGVDYYLKSTQPSSPYYATSGDGVKVAPGTYYYGFNGPETITVTAKPKEGFQFPTGVKTTWTWSSPGIFACPKPGETPTTKPAIPTGAPTGAPAGAPAKPGDKAPSTSSTTKAPGTGTSRATAGSTSASTGASGKPASSNAASGKSSSSKSASNTSASGSSSGSSSSAKSSSSSLAKTGVTAVAWILGIAIAAAIIGGLLMLVRRKNDGK